MINIKLNDLIFNKKYLIQISTLRRFFLWFSQNVPVFYSVKYTDLIRKHERTFLPG